MQYISCSYIQLLIIKSELKSKNVQYILTDFCSLYLSLCSYFPSHYFITKDVRWLEMVKVYEVSPHTEINV